MSKEKKGMMFVLSSPSGVGKTTLTKKIAQNNKNFTISVSHTTRKPRPNEINGKDYQFVNIQKFNTLVKENNFFEYANIFDNLYGTLKKQVLELLSRGKDVLFDIDWQGTKQLKKIKNLSLVTIFILPPNLKALKERLLNRHGGQEKLVEKRMNKFNEEISHWNEYNYVVINDDLNKCYDEILRIIMSEKRGVSQKQNLGEIKKKIKELYKISPMGVFTSFCTGLIHSAIFSLTAVYAAKMNFNIFEISLLIFSIIISGALFQWPLGYLSDKINRRIVIIISSLAASIFGFLAIISVGPVPEIMHLSLDWKTNKIFFFIFVTIFAGFSLPIYAINIALTNDYISKDKFVAAGGGLQLVMGLGAMGGPITCAIFMNFFGAN